MATIVSCSVTPKMEQFLKDNNLSPSVLIQNKIIELMKQTNEPEFQMEIQRYQERNETVHTRWQKALERYAHEDDTRLKVAECFLDQIMGRISKYQVTEEGELLDA